MKTIMIQPGVEVPAQHADAVIDWYELSNVLPINSEPCPRCGLGEHQHLWLVLQDGDVIDCSCLCQLTTEYLLLPAVLRDAEFALLPGGPTLPNLWATVASSVDGNPRVVWVKVTEARRSANNVVFVANGAQHILPETHPLVARVAAS